MDQNIHKILIIRPNEEKRNTVTLNVCQHPSSMEGKYKCMTLHYYTNREPHMFFRKIVQAILRERGLHLTTSGASDCEMGQEMMLVKSINESSRGKNNRFLLLLFEGPTGLLFQAEKSIHPNEEESRGNANPNRGSKGLKGLWGNAEDQHLNCKLCASPTSFLQWLLLWQWRKLEVRGEKDTVEEGGQDPYTIPKSLTRRVRKREGHDQYGQGDLQSFQEIFSSVCFFAYLLMYLLSGLMYQVLRSDPKTKKSKWSKTTSIYQIFIEVLLWTITHLRSSEYMQEQNRQGLCPYRNSYLFC